MLPGWRTRLEQGRTAVAGRAAKVALHLRARVRGLKSRALGRLRPLVAPRFNEARGWYAKREPREKLLMRILGVILGLLLVYNLVYLPVVGLGASLSNRVVARQHDLAEVRHQVLAYQRLTRLLTAAEKRTIPGKNFSLFSILEQSLTKAVGRDKIDSITPTETAVPGGYRQSSVELKLTNVSLAQIVTALYDFQSLATPVTVGNLHIKQRSQDPHSYDVEMTCTTLGRNG